MSNVMESGTLELEGHTFEWEVHEDDTCETPWSDFDGHGPVRETDRRGRRPADKRPGERPMLGRYYYDWQEAMKIAKREGWSVSEHLRPENWDSMTAGQRTELAVEHDFEYLLAWVDGDWTYAGVVVRQVVDEDADDGEEESCWGVEYWPREPVESSQLLRMRRFGMVIHTDIVPNKNAHLFEVIEDLAGSIVHSINKREEKAAREAAERRCWEERDVVTEEPNVPR